MFRGLQVYQVNLFLNVRVKVPSHISHLTSQSIHMSQINTIKNNIKLCFSV